MYTHFTFDGNEYRTNSDGSYIEVLIGRASWTHAFAPSVQAEARRVLRAR